MVSSLFRRAPEPVLLDLGGVATRLVLPNRGLVVTEPTAVLRQGRDQARRLEAIGSDAVSRWYGRDRGDPELSLVRPLLTPHAPDTEALTGFLDRLLSHSRGRSGRHRLDLLLGRPAGLSDAGDVAWRAALRGVGVDRAAWVPQGVAAALGAGVAPDDAGATLLVDVGGTAARVTLLVAGRVVAERAVAAGGVALDRAVIDWMVATHGLTPDLADAEQLRLGLPSLAPPEDGLGPELPVAGVGPGARRSQRRLVSHRDVAFCVMPVVAALIDAVRAVLDRAPPEVTPDLADRGLLLHGGAAQTAGLADILRGAIGLPVALAEDPELCVAKGLWAVRRLQIATQPLL